jgi:hypothetical protein
MDERMPRIRSQRPVELGSHRQQRPHPGDAPGLGTTMREPGHDELGNRVQVGWGDDEGMLVAILHLGYQG